MSEEKTEVKPEVVAKPITVKSIIVGVIGAIACVTAALILGPTSDFVPTAEVAVMMAVILALLQLFTPLKFTLAEYVFIYAMTYGGAAGYDIATRWYVGFSFHTEYEWLKEMSKFIPGYYYIPKEAYDLALQAGVTPPWGMLMPSFLASTVILLLLNALVILGVLPFRKQIVEIERLPYPATSAAFTAVNTAILPKEEQTAPILGSRRNWLFLGLLVGLITVIFTEGYLVSVLWPGAPVIPEYIGDSERGDPGMFFDYLPGFIVGLHTSSLFPWGWFSYFVPLEALFSIIIFTFIGMFILVWEVKVGKITYEPGYNYGYIVYFDYLEGINLYMMGQAMLIGAVIAHFIVGYKYILETIKNKEKEPGFISPQMMWILSFLSVIILAAYGATLGAPIHVSLLIALFMIYINTMWSVRGLGEVNLAISDYGVIEAYSAAVSEALGVTVPGCGKVTSAMFAMIMFPYEIMDSRVSAWAFIETSRFAFLSRVSVTKAIIIGILAGVVIAGFVGCFVKASLVYGLGITGTFGISSRWHVFDTGINVALYRARAYGLRGTGVDRIEGERLMFFIAFLLLSMAIVFIRSKFAVIMPVTAISAALAFYMVDIDVTGWAYTFLPFLIIKYLVLKIGGPKLDEQVARPFFAGAAAGGLFGTVISGIAITLIALGMIG